jgi:hypothetical protein
MNVVKLGPEYFPQSAIGRPVANGEIYVGIVDLDPEIVANQKQVSVQQEDGSIVTVTQPVSTGGGGVPMYDGSPVTLLVDGNYSLKVLNSAGSQEYYFPSAVGSEVSSTSNKVSIGYYGNSLTAAISAIGTDEITVMIDTTVTLTGNDTVPANITLEKTRGGSFTGAFTLTINGGMTGDLASQWFASNVTPEGSPKITEVRPEWFGTIGNGVADDTVPLQSAFDFSSVAQVPLLMPSGTFMISADLIVGTSNFMILGINSDTCTLKAMSAATINTGMILASSGVDNVVVKNITIDGNSDNNTTASFSGVFTVLIDGVDLSDSVIKNTPKNGIHVFGASGQNLNIDVKNNKFLNIGYDAVNIEFSAYVNVTGNSVISSGGHGIVITAGTTPATDFSSDVIISNNYVNRGTPPTTLFVDSPGDVEIGFLIGIGAASRRFNVSDNICVDNRNASTDGIGLGEDKDNPHVDIVISNNVVQFAGGFGIDATNQSTVTGNTVEDSATHGIAIVTDLGMDMNFVNINDNVIINSNASNVAGANGIYIASLVATNMNYINIGGNIVYDTRTPKQTEYGIAFDNSFITFGTSINLNNNDISGNLLGGVNAVGAAITGLSAYANEGFITANVGQAQVPNGNTSVAVTHGLDVTPIMSDITVTAISPETAALGYYAHSPTATTFAITMTAAAGASSLFSWSATTSRTS